MFLNIIRHLLRPFVKIIFRVSIEGPAKGALIGPNTLIIANHVSSMDGLFLFLFLNDTPTFAVTTETAKISWKRFFLRFVKTLELDPLNPHAIKNVVKQLHDGGRVLIFPEGKATTSGSLMKIYDGPAMAAALGDSTILPVGIEGPQYSRFSLLGQRVRQRWFPKVTITLLEPRKINLGEDLQGHERRTKSAAAMLHIMREIAYENAFEPVTFYQAVVNAMRRHGPNREIIADSTGANLTYRQLLLRAGVLAQFISKRTQSQDCVGIMLPSTAAAIVTLTATQSCGRTTAMMNFTSGTRGLLIACETAAIKIVVTSRAFITQAELGAQAAAIEEVAEVIYLEDLRDEVSIAHKLRAAVSAFLPITTYRMRYKNRDPDGDCVILFTSGSEGIPKGVVLTHSNIVANRAQVQTLIALTHEDTVLNVLPIFHAFGLLGGTLIPLFDGAKIYCYPSPLHYRVIPELSYQLGATCLFGTNTFLSGYAKHGHAYDFHKLRFVIAGAEKLTEQTRSAWSEKFGIRIYEGYGATEASPVIAVNTPMGCKPDTVGQLLAKMDYYLEPVEGISTGGRLVVRGPNIMRGYLFHGGDEERYPPSTDCGQGWYDTGDIVTVDDEGFISIVGRLKRFAKIGGEMVSLSQTEEIATAAWPDVAHAAVALSSTRKGEQIVLLSEFEHCDRRPLVQVAKDLGIPELSLPKRVFYCEKIPALGSGKVDYPALREIAEDLVG